jgi:hypothetical protein
VSWSSFELRSRPAQEPLGAASIGDAPSQSAGILTKNLRQFYPNLMTCLDGLSIIARVIRRATSKLERPSPFNFLGGALCADHLQLDSGDDGIGNRDLLS